MDAAKLLVSMKTAGEDAGGMWIVSSDHRKSSTAAAAAEAEQERSARHSDDRGAMESLSPLRRSSHWHSSPDLTKLALLRSTSSKSLDGNRGRDRSEPGVGTAQLASRVSQTPLAPPSDGNDRTWRRKRLRKEGESSRLTPW